jgi:ribonuclease HI
VQQDPHAVQIFVDGSCFVHRKREAGYAGFVLYPDDPEEQQIVFSGFRQSTIPRMELAACIAAMEWVRQARPSVSRVQVFSDSRYVVDSIPRAPYWQRNKWRNSQGRPMEHSDLWKEFLSARNKAGVRVDFGWVKGKSSALLRKVDKTAKEAARSGTGVDRGYKAGKIGRPKTKGGASTMFPAAGQVLAVRVYGARLVGRKDENRITFELYDELTNQCGPKHFAYAQPEVGAELHRQRAFRVQMNDDPKYPQVLRVLEEIPIPKTKKTGRSEAPSTRTDDSGPE